ncbi:MAG TPA: twin-arginine translocase TatA/TatE family subunit [Alphaproteobacteria bacterium]|nr:twin-arginine translocase TatA/TatE family subunit [Alphaproteobacteria bacterium]
MGSFSILHLLVVLAVVLIIFGAGRLPRVMGDLGRGIRSFKEGLNDDKPSDPNKIEKKD